MPVYECEYTLATTSIKAYPTRFCLAKGSRKGVFGFLCLGRYRPNTTLRSFMRSRVNVQKKSGVWTQALLPHKIKVSPKGREQSTHSNQTESEVTTRGPLGSLPSMKKFKEHISLARFTNYKIGGPARFFFEAKNEADIAWAVAEAKARKIPCFILGGGTNLLIGDAGFDGLVLRINIEGVAAKRNIITAGAGVGMAKLTAFAAKRSLGGFDWAGGLPGTLGGAIRGNAGCFGGEIKDTARTVRSFNTKTMRTITRNAKQCRFSYRASIFKQCPEEIILGATFRMKTRSLKEISATLQKEKMWRKAHHPLDHPSAGSVFKNVPLALILKPKSKQYRDAVKNRMIMYRRSSFSVKTDPVPVIAAAKLIGESGLAGQNAWRRHDLHKTYEFHLEQKERNGGRHLFSSWNSAKRRSIKNSASGLSRRSRSSPQVKGKKWNVESSVKNEFGTFNF